MSNDQNPPHSPAATLQENQWIAAIEEHLAAVRWCLDRSQHGGRIKGYSAALLLFCIIDAMGNGLLLPKKKQGRPLYTRLDVLLHHPFDPKELKLDETKVNNLTSWYRNKLSHTGAMALNAFVDVGEGDAFNFDENGTPRVLVEPLYDVVKVAWEGRPPSIFQLSNSTAVPEPSALSLSTMTQKVSGAATRQGKPITAEDLQQFIYRAKPKNGR